MSALVNHPLVGLFALRIAAGNRSALPLDSAARRLTGLWQRNRDRGPGFDVGTIVATSRGLGLFGLRDRIESLGGVFSIVSKIGAGTSLTARFCDIKRNIGTGRA